MLCNTSDKQISKTFQGQILQFSRTKNCPISQHSITPFWTPYWLKHLIAPFTIFTCSAMADHIFLYYCLSITTLCKMAPVTGHSLQLHLRYRNCIWNKGKEIKHCFCRKMFSHYSRVLQVITPRMSQILLGEIIWLHWNCCGMNK